MTMVLAIYAEKRIYFFRAKDLPTDIETIDLRPDMGLTQLTLNNILKNGTKRVFSCGTIYDCIPVYFV